MADDSLAVQESGAPTHLLDIENLGGSPKLTRERHEIGGALLAEVARVKNSDLASTEYGLAVRARERTTATATLANVATSTISATLLAANVNRIGARIVNDSVQTLLVKYGATASATSFTTKLFADQEHALPPGYTGLLDGLLDGGTGTARVTEW